MWHTVFITSHALAGTVAFVAGWVAIRRGSVFAIYLWSMVGMLLFLVLAMATQWSEFETPTLVLFSALVALGGLMVLRAAQSRPLVPSGSAGPSGRYFDQIGSNLLGLFDAFLVVTVLNAGAPGWIVAATGVWWPSWGTSYFERSEAGSCPGLFLSGNQACVIRGHTGHQSTTHGAREHDTLGSGGGHAGLGGA